MPEHDRELATFQLNVDGTMLFTTDTLRLLSEHPKILGNVALHHDQLAPTGTGYSQFLMNYAIVVLVAYFEGFTEELRIGYADVERQVGVTEWQLLNEMRNRRNCIIHNSCRVDEKYLEYVENSRRTLGEALIPTFDYLQQNSRNLKAVAMTLGNLQSVNRETTK